MQKRLNLIWILLGILLSLDIITVLFLAGVNIFTIWLFIIIALFLKIKAPKFVKKHFARKD